MLNTAQTIVTTCTAVGVVYGCLLKTDERVAMYNYSDTTYSQKLAHVSMGALMGLCAGFFTAVVVDVAKRQLS